MPENSSGRKPGEGESVPPELVRAPYGRMALVDLANLIAATRRPGPQPQNRGITPQSELGVSDFLDAARKRLAAEEAQESNATEAPACGSRS